jgi:hypothetical protein
MSASVTKKLCHDQASFPASRNSVVGSSNIVITTLALGWFVGWASWD